MIMTDKGLIFKIYKQLIKNIKKKPQKTNGLKMGRRPEQTFLQRGHADGQQAHRKGSQHH